MNDKRSLGVFAVGFFLISFISGFIYQSDAISFASPPDTTNFRKTHQEKLYQKVIDNAQVELSIVDKNVSNPDVLKSLSSAIQNKESLSSLIEKTRAVTLSHQRWQASQNARPSPVESINDSKTVEKNDTPPPMVVSPPDSPLPDSEKQYDWSLFVDGICMDGNTCAQDAVDTYDVSYISFPAGSSTLTEIAGHEFGPAGIINRFKAGDTVKVSGYGSGVYRVDSLVYVEKHQAEYNVSGRFAFQTCIGNQMVLAYSTRIGD